MSNLFFSCSLSSASRDERLQQSLPFNASLILPQCDPDNAFFQVTDPQRPDIKCDISHYGYIEDFELCQNPTTLIARGQWSNSETNRQRFIAKIKSISKLPINTLTIRYVDLQKRSHEFTKSLLNCLNPALIKFNAYNVFCDHELTSLVKRAMAKGTLEHLMIATCSLSKEFSKVLWKWLQKGRWRYVELSKVVGPSFDISFLEKLIEWWVQKGAGRPRTFSIDLVISGHEDIVLLNSFLYNGKCYFKNHPKLRNSSVSIQRDGWRHFDVQMS